MKKILCDLCKRDIKEEKDIYGISKFLFIKKMAFM